MKRVGMFKVFLLIITSLLLPITSLADVLSIKKDAPKSYTVKKGDTLWDISEVFLNESWLWPKLWRLNPNIENPHLIYPGDVLRLVFDAQGNPMLVRGKPELKWSPKIRTTLKEQSPIATIPLSVVAPFFKYDALLTKKQIDDAPHVLGNDRSVKSSVDGFKLYINADLLATNAYGVYHQGEAINDPETGDLIGYHAILVGSGKAIRTGNMANNEPSTLYVDNIKQEINAGAIVLPINEEQLYPSYFAMQAAADNVSARIIQSLSGLREFGKLDVILLNRGSDDFVKPGDIFTIKRKGPNILQSKNGPVYEDEASRWTRIISNNKSTYNIPEEIIGTAMAFKVYSEISLVLVLKTQQSIRLEDVFTSP